MKLSVENINFEINGKTILKDISYNFAEGKRTGIIGANGAGKSTFLKILCLLNKKFTGEVKIDGEDIKKISRRRLAQMIAILTQEREVPLDTTVRQLTSYGRFPHRGIFQRSNPQEDREAIEWALEVTQMKPFENRQVSSLSGGERQRAWLSMTLAQRPKILLLDEPTTYLDIKHQLEVMKIISDLNKKYGMTIIMVLHDIIQARMFTDDLIVISNHSIFQHGDPQIILNTDLVKNVFGVKSEIFKNAQGQTVLVPLELNYSTSRRRSST